MSTAERYLDRAWKSAKTWRSIRLGPVTLHLRLGRSYSRSPRFRLTLESNARSAVHESTSLVQARVPETAVVVGMGAEIGPALVRKLMDQGMRVAILSRSDLDGLPRERVQKFSCDVTNERATKRVFAEIIASMGPPSLVVYGVQGWSPGRAIDVEVAAFEEAWRANCLGAFIVAQQAARAMRAVGGGTIVFLGATSGTIGRCGHLNLAVGKFGLRAIAQVMARELGHEGIHVVHVIIDADVQTHAEGDFPHTDPLDLAEMVCWLHRQPRNIWTHELDARPHNEAFWEHC
jgi:NAD(P)-dependent dehydrogenase (short-subunit alcohol dehydrogenase family)